MTKLEQVQQENAHLRALVEDDPMAAQINKHMEDPLPYEV